MSELMKLWRNAIRYEAQGPTSPYYAMANSIIPEIRKEWTRRGKNPPNPDDYFKWPSTEAYDGNGRLSGAGWVEEGVLKYMGYSVGRTSGENREVRQRILSHTFEGPLPPVFPINYSREWGEPGSSGRLRKMAETLAALTRNAKRRRTSKLRDAIRDWESDLEYLYHEYYIDRFHFLWPDPNI